MKKERGINFVLLVTIVGIGFYGIYTSEKEKNL